MKKWMLFALAIVFLNPANFIAAQTQAEKPVIKIGFIIPLTGDMTAFTENFKKAAALAIEQLPTSNKCSYEVLFEDDNQRDPKAAVNAFNKLVLTDKVGAVITI